MRILLTPWGRGFGHTGRALALAAAARGVGHSARVLLPTPTDVPDAAPTLHTTVPVPENPWDAFRTTDAIARLLKHDRALLLEYRPDAVIVDGRISMILAAESLKIPVATIIRDSYTPGHRFGTVDDDFWSSMLTAAQNAAHDAGVPPPVRDVRELFTRHPAICPSTPELEGIADGVVQRPIHYAGLITWQRPTGLRHPEPVHPTDILVYGALRTPGDVDAVVQAFNGTTHRLYVVMPNPSVSGRIEEHAVDRIIAVAYLDLEQHAHAFAGAIAHGGHGICLTLMSAGTPTVFAPPADRPEQRFNAERMCRHGHGQLLDPADGQAWCQAPTLLAQQPRHARTAQTPQRIKAAIAFAVSAAALPPQ